MRFFLPEPGRFALYSFCDRTQLASNKHGLALPFLNGLATSPLRTANVHEASMIVFPALVDWYARGLCRANVSWDEYLRNLTSEAAAVIRAAGDARVPQMLLAADFKSTPLVASIRRALPRVRIGHYFSTGKNCSFAVGYMKDVDAFAAWPGRSWRLGAGVSELVPTPPEELLRTPRHIRIEFSGQVLIRGVSGMQMRYSFFHHSSRLRDSSWVTTSTPTNRSRARPCNTSYTRNGPASSQLLDDHLYCFVRLPYADVYAIRTHARYSLFLPGDDATSDRLQNALTALTVPVVIGPTPSWLPFSFAVPWRKLVVHVSPTAFREDPAAALSALPSDDASAQRALIARHVPDFSFSATGSRLHENILRAAAEARC